MNNNFDLIYPPDLLNIITEPIPLYPEKISKLERNFPGPIIYFPACKKHDESRNNRSD